MGSLAQIVVGMGGEHERKKESGGVRYEVLKENSWSECYGKIYYYEYLYLEICVDTG